MWCILVLFLLRGVYDDSIMRALFSYLTAGVALFVGFVPMDFDPLIISVLFKE
jgi:hypothetical protein